MVLDAAGLNVDFGVNEQLNAGAQRFCDLQNASDEPLWPGCESKTLLSITARLLNIKTDYNLLEVCYDFILQLIKDVTPDVDKMPKNFYEAKKLNSGLGLPNQ